MDIDLSLWQFTIILVAGVVTGIINTLASSGSLIILPIFIFICGLPPGMANGTNRIGVLLQASVGVWTFHRHGNLPLKGIQWLVGPSAGGALLGAWLAVDMSNDFMLKLIGFLMIFMLGVILLKPARWLKPGIGDPSHFRKPTTFLVFVLIGLYGGIIQAGTGVFLLAALVLIAQYDLVKANGLKMLLVLGFNIPAFFVFLAHGQIHWGYGLLMAAAQMVGAYLGASFANRVPNAPVYIRYLLIIIVIGASIRFFIP